MTQSSDVNGPWVEEAINSVAFGQGITWDIGYISMLQAGRDGQPEQKVLGMFVLTMPSPIMGTPPIVGVQPCELPVLMHKESLTAAVTALAHGITAQADQLRNQPPPPVAPNGLIIPGR